MKTKDILLFDNQLSEEELAIMNSARDYCQKELMPTIIDANRNEVFNKSIYKDMGQLGFLGAPIEGYGCAGGRIGRTLWQDIARGADLSAL